MSQFHPDPALWARVAMAQVMFAMCCALNMGLRLGWFAGSYLLQKVAVQ